MHSNSPTRELTPSPPLDIYASIARARAIAAGRSACRNIDAFSPLPAAFVSFLDPPPPFQVGSDTPSITTPYTDDERIQLWAIGRHGLDTDWQLFRVILIRLSTVGSFRSLDNLSMSLMGETMHQDLDA